jgi:hypothetical protein
LHNPVYPLLTNLAEEERYQPPAMDLEVPELHPLEQEGKWIPLPREEEIHDRFCFAGFLDGAQRTVQIGVFRTPGGAGVPLYRARVTAGLLIRDRRVARIGAIRSWEILAAPFRAAGEDPEELADGLRNQGLPVWTGREAFGIGGDPRILRGLLARQSPWILADTSYRGLSEDPDHGLISSADLWRETEVRARAQGRIAHLRQLLELLLLLVIRFPGLGLLEAGDAPSAEAAVMVDGPLLLSTRRRRWLPGFLSRMGVDIGEEDLQHRLLRNTIGLVKSHRLRPKDLPAILTLPEGYRSSAFAFNREVDVHGRSLQDDMEAEGDHRYPSWHVTAYVRLRRRPHSDLAGLVRIDLLRPDPQRVLDPLSPDEQNELSQWATSVYRERRPALPGEREQPFPISLLERALHTRIPPAMALSRSLSVEGG